jgi:hypothetical protein
VSIRLEMLQIARVAPKALGESTALVREYLLKQQNQDGGFRDRAGRSDLYYTVFALDGLLALQAELPALRVADYLGGFRGGEGLDFVHLCCLARCWAALGDRARLTLPGDLRKEITARVQEFCSADGGFSPVRQGSNATAYGCFLALAAHQDLQAPLPDALVVARALKWLETPDGAWANERGLKLGSTNATAAAATLLRHLSMPVDARVGHWLRAQCHPQGGFLAAPGAPLPDLLSTATALHALAGMQVAIDDIRETCLEFVDSLWTNEGGFFGHWGEESLDSEYTYYGLLALGHLSL